MLHSNSVTRTTIIATGAIALVLSVASAATGQDMAPRTRKLELRVSSGALVPTGDQRQQLKPAQLTAAQLSWVLNPRLALTGTFSWARSRDVASTDDPKLDVFTSDIGAELRSAELQAGRLVSFSAFAGLGAGARSYNYRNIDAAATNNIAAYGAVGGELGIGRVGLRVEARNYATGFKPLLSAGESTTRNDLVFMGALRFNKRRAPQQ